MEGTETYSESDWIEELAEYFCDNDRQTGDLDCKQIAARYNLGTEAALRKMGKIAEANPGNYVVVMVRDGHGKPPIKVLRKVSQNGI